MYHVAYGIYHNIHRVPTRTTYRARWNLVRCWRASDGVLCRRRSSAADAVLLLFRSWLSCRMRRTAITTLIITHTVFIVYTVFESTPKSVLSIILLYALRARETENHRLRRRRRRLRLWCVHWRVPDTNGRAVAAVNKVHWENQWARTTSHTRTTHTHSYTTHTMTTYARAFDPLRWSYNTFTLPLINTFFFNLPPRIIYIYTNTFYRIIYHIPIGI